MEIRRSHRHVTKCVRDFFGCESHSEYKRQYLHALQVYKGGYGIQMRLGTKEFRFSVSVNSPIDIYMASYGGCQDLSINFGTFVGLFKILGLVGPNFDVLLSHFELHEFQTFLMSVFENLAKFIKSLGQISIGSNADFDIFRPRKRNKTGVLMSGYQRESDFIWKTSFPK